MKTKIHAIAGITAFLTIFIFFTSTVLVELFGSLETIATVKQLIVYALFILIPAIAVAGAIGNILGREAKNGLVGAKRRRMPLIAANGIIVLLPAALYLNKLAASGDFGTMFYPVQALELFVGAINLILMGKNIMDGLMLTGRITKAS